MEFSVREPSPDLNTIVKQYMIVTSLKDYEKLLFLPNVGNFIIFNQGIESCIYKYDSNEVVSHIPRDFSVSPKGKDVVKLGIDESHLEDTIKFPILVVELLPTGYNRLFSKNAFDLRTKHISLNNCIDDKSISFDALYTIDGLDRKITYIEEQLVKLKEAATPVQNVFLVIEEIIQYIIDTMQKVNVSDILDKFSYSRSSLERDFKKIVGYTPKEFILITRFCVIFKDLTLNGYDYMKQDHDFFDQSHMNKAFKKFIDISPSKLQGYINDNDIQIYQLNRDYA